MSVSVASYNKKYLRMKPEVTQIFDLLDEYLDFCRFQYPAVDFNPSDLYRNTSQTWQWFVKSRNRAYYRNNEQQRNQQR